MTATHSIVAQTTWSDIGIPLVFITLVGIVVIVFVWQNIAPARARSSVAREEAYRTLAEESTKAQQRTATALEELTGELRSVRARTDELERILKTVE
jgi:Tfp pilus assembly protein PilO